MSHLNLQSLNNKIEETKIEVNSLEFDVFSFSKSQLHDKVDDYIISIPGYNVIRQDRGWNSHTLNSVPKKGGGVGLYVKSQFGYSTAQLQSHNRNSEDIECLWVKILMEHSKNIIIGVVYSPPSGNNNKFCEELTDLVLDITDLGNHDVFLMGDFNIHYNERGTNEMRSLIQFEQLTNLKQLIKSPTRNNNIIDLIYTNSSDVSQSGVYDILLSDHDLIYCSRKKSKVKSFKTEFVGRSYRAYDKNIFQDYLNNHNWNHFSSLTGVDECWNHILQIITEFLNISCPIKKKFVRTKNEPWVTNEILELLFEKNQAWKKAKKSKTPEDIAHAKTLRNNAKNVIRRAKSSFVQDYLDNDNISTKNFWEKIAMLIVMPTRNSGDYMGR